MPEVTAWVDVRVFPSSDGLAFFFRDVTVRRRTQQRYRLLAEASRVLIESLDSETTLKAVAQLAVPGVADWCVIDVVREDGSLVRAAIRHRDPDRDWWTPFRRSKGFVDGGGIGPIASSVTAVMMPRRSDADCVRVASFRCWPCAAPDTGAGWDAGAGSWNARSHG